MLTGWRTQVGDILVQGEKGAQILVVPELVDHLEFNLTQACATLMPITCGLNARDA